MNQLAFKHIERLLFASRRLARDIVIMRNECGLANLYPELYAARNARLSACTRRRIKLSRWVRAHPHCNSKQVREVLTQLEIPQTKEELVEAIRRCEQKAIKQVREQRERERPR